MKSDPVWDPQVWRRDRRAAPGDQEGPVNLSGNMGDMEDVELEAIASSSVLVASCS